MKTHKAASSRLHITASGKIMRIKVGKSHLRRRKAKRVKRLFDEKLPLHASDKARIKRLLPYS